MADLPLFSHIFFIASLLLIFIVLFLILRLREQITNIVTRLLIYGFLCIAGWIVLTHISLTIYVPGESPLENSIVATGSNLVVILGMILVAFFVKLLVQPTLNLRQTSIFVAFISLMAGARIGLVYATQNRDEVTLHQIRNLVTLLNVLVLTYFLYVIIGDYRNLTSENLTDKQSTQIKWLFVGIFATAIPMIPIGVLSTILGLEYLTLGYILISISMSIIAFAYIYEPRVAFLIPDRVNLILVVNSQGTLRYSKSFSGGTDIEESDMNYLIASALVAIRSMMSEFYQSEVKPRIISFEDQLIQFKFGEGYFLAVFCTHESTLIREALESASVSIEEKYGDDIQNKMMSHKELHLQKEIDNAFYFVYQ